MSNPKKDKYYSLQEITEKKLLNRSSFNGTRALVLADRSKRNLLKSVIIGRERGARYRIKGENIIKFLAELETGRYRI